MVEASKPDNKANIRRLIHYYEDHITNDPNITVVKEEANYDMLVNGGFDAVIIAVGGKTRKLDVPGGDRSTVVYANDYLNGSKKVEGKNVAVIGGGITGAETALELNGEGKNVTVVEMADRFLANPGSSCQAYSITIAQSDIKIMTGKRLVAVDDKEITLTDRWGNENKVAVDNVVIAAGFIPQYDLANQLEENTDIEVYNVGDSKKVRQIYDAVREGVIAARQI